MARFRSKSSTRQQHKADPIRASKTSGTTTTTTSAAAMASTKGFHMWGSRRKEIRPPSSASSAASEDGGGGGCRCKEFMASQHIQQDMVSIKTYLHRLRRILQDAETATLNSQNVSRTPNFASYPDLVLIIEGFGFAFKICVCPISCQLNDIGCTEG